MKIEPTGYLLGYKILLHNEKDLPDAILINPSFHIEGSKENITLKNKYFSKTSTKSKPCQKYWPKTCHDIYMQKKIAKDYQCQVPIFFTGYHLTKSELPNCTNDVIMEILSNDYESNCEDSIPCEYTKYELKYGTSGDYNWGFSTIEVYIIYEGPIEEEHYTSSISVDEQTLIGQAGGLFGILLGWSGMNLAELIKPVLNRLIIPALYMF